MDAIFYSDCNAWIHAAEEHSDIADPGIIQKARLKEFVMTVADYISMNKDDPTERHDAIAQAIATIEHLAPTLEIGMLLIKEFYYSLTTYLLDQQYGNTTCTTDLDAEIERVRLALREVPTVS